MIEEGRYRARPVAAALGFAGTGKEQIGVLFEFVDPVGYRLTWYGYFTDDTFERTVESLRACGWQGDSLDEFGEGKPLPPGFGAEVEVVVKHETYNDKTTPRIAFINSGGGLAMKSAMQPNEAQGFARKMRARIAALDRAAGRGQRNAAPPRRSGFEQLPQDELDRQGEDRESGGDDVPF